jgi:hypothetical protein
VAAGERTDVTNTRRGQEARRRVESQGWAVRWATADLDRLLTARRRAAARNDQAGITAADRALAAKQEELRRAEARKAGAEPRPVQRLATEAEQVREAAQRTADGGTPTE